MGLVYLEYGICIRTTNTGEHMVRNVILSKYDENISNYFPGETVPALAIEIPENTILYKSVRTTHRKYPYALLEMITLEKGVCALDMNSLFKVRVPKVEIRSVLLFRTKQSRVSGTGKMGKYGYINPVYINSIQVLKDGQPASNFFKMHPGVDLYSDWRPAFKYNEPVVSADYDSDVSKSCSAGIHGFLDRKTALTYFWAVI